MSRKILELCVEKVELENLAAGRRRNTRHALLVDLVWPRPGISERSAVMKVEPDGKVCDFAGCEWIEKVLLKETVDGTFGIRASVTGPLNDGQFSRLIAFSGERLLKIAAGEAGDISPLAAVPFQYMGKYFKDLDDIPVMRLGSGAKTVDVPPRAVKNVSLEIPLDVPADVFQSSRKKSHGRTVSRKKLILKEGQPNGRVLLNARIR